MKPHIKKAIKIIPLLEIGVSIILLIVSFLIKDIPENKTYSYNNNQIITNSWHNIFSFITGVIFITILILTIVCICIWIAEKIKSKEKIIKFISAIGISFVVCSLIILFSDVLVVGLWTDDDYSPSYYRFSDEQHTIVIEERSFLLYGGGTIYQIKENNDAIILYTFSTDDGGRNNGHYDINWYDDYAEITYNTFNTKDSKCTSKITFID